MTSQRYRADGTHKCLVRPFSVYILPNHNTKPKFFASEPRKTPRRIITHKSGESLTEGKIIGKSAKNTASTTKDNART